MAGAHLAAFYTTPKTVLDRRFDGMIITGAPVEILDFDAVDYWSELAGIMSWNRTHVWSTLHICWGAMAGLWHHFGIRKTPRDEKLFGVFEQRVTRPGNPLVRGFDDRFWAPHSRHTGLSAADVRAAKGLRILAEGDETGPYLLSTENGRQIFVLGHPEYELMTLDGEYRRDAGRGLGIRVPANCYPGDDSEKRPVCRWKSHAHLLYQNWLNYYVYQDTPYDLGRLAGIDRGCAPGGASRIRRPETPPRGRKASGGVFFQPSGASGRARMRRIVRLRHLSDQPPSAFRSPPPCASAPSFRFPPAFTRRASASFSH